MKTEEFGEKYIAHFGYARSVDDSGNDHIFLSCALPDEIVVTSDYYMMNTTSYIIMFLNGVYVVSNYLFFDKHDFAIPTTKTQSSIELCVGIESYRVMNQTPIEISRGQSIYLKVNVPDYQKTNIRRVTIELVKLIERD